MSQSDVTAEGLQGPRPGREATTGANTGVEPAVRTDERRRRRGGEEAMVPEATFESYYGKPVINEPTWEAPNIPGYLFLGGLAGAGSVVAAGAQGSNRPGLARVMKTGSAVSVGLGLAALVHDLGRRTRFFNMLRTFKPTSPMSVGSWLLVTYGPASAVAALSDLTGVAPVIGTVATAGAALTGPAVATYTAALISDTAVPAWHEGHRHMPFVFAASAASAAAGMGLVGAPLHESAPVRRLAITASSLELAGTKAMQKRMGLPGEAYEHGKAKRYKRAGETLAAAGTLMAALGRRSRVVSALAGTALMAGSALTRFAIFEAGLVSARDPKYTVVPQRQRLEARETRP